LHKKLIQTTGQTMQAFTHEAVAEQWRLLL
jgi:hypothetical protein